MFQILLSMQELKMSQVAKRFNADPLRSLGQGEVMTFYTV